MSSQSDQRDFKNSLVTERAWLILPKLISYMEKKEEKLRKLEAHKEALTVYDDLIITRAVVNAVLTGEHKSGMMEIIGLWDIEEEKHPAAQVNHDLREVRLG